MKLKDYTDPKYELVRIVITNKSFTKAQLYDEYITLEEAKALFGLCEIYQIADDDNNGITHIAIFENKLAKMN